MPSLCCVCLRIARRNMVLIVKCRGGMPNNAVLNCNVQLFSPTSLKLTLCVVILVWLRHLRVSTCRCCDVYAIDIGTLTSYPDLRLIQSDTYVRCFFLRLMTLKTARLYFAFQNVALIRSGIKGLCEPAARNKKQTAIELKLLSLPI